MSRQNSFTYDDLIRCANGDMFGPGNAQLPSPPMLMFDLITTITETGGAHDKGEIIAELDVRPDLWFFDCHFKGDPVMPGCLGLDAMWQFGFFFKAGLAMKAKAAPWLHGRGEITGQIEPDAKLVTYHLDVKRVIARKLVMGIADGTVTVDGKEIYRAEDLRVGLFKPGQM